MNESLPIALFRNEIVESVKTHKTTIISGETGSGKSTQTVQFLLGLYKGRIACTQPRRVAAVSVAQRVAFEQKVLIGDLVGYTIRFEDKTSRKTKIKFVTDGVLLRECMSDSELLDYDVIILDEAHERSLSTDILMGLLRQLQDRRPSLRIVVMSATLQVDLYQSFFEDTNTIIVSGRQYPVGIYYTAESVDDYVDAALLTCLQIHKEEEPGGVLVFLPGQEDIESLQSLLMDHLPSVEMMKNTATIISENKENKNDDTVSNPLKKAKTLTIESTTSSNNNNSNINTISNNNNHIKDVLQSFNDFEIFPLYAAMTGDEQMLAFTPAKSNVRKFVLSTNIAETSVTISGIKYVVDTGFVKTRLIQAQTGVEMLKVIPISKAQANQRAGRAGRESDGKTFRLFQEVTYEDLEDVSVPEIQRVNISQVILQLKAIGVVSPFDFPYLSPPNPTSIRIAFEALLALGALNADQNLTDHGRKMVKLPLEPHYSHLLLKSVEFRCVSEMLTVVSLLSSDNIFLLPHKEEDKKNAGLIHRRFASKDGDLPTLLNIYESWIKVHKDKNWTNKNYFSYRSLVHANSVRNQLELLLKNSNIGIDTTLSCYPEKEPFLRCLTSGLFLNTARLVLTNQENQYAANRNGNSYNNNNNNMINSSFNNLNLKATSKFSSRYSKNKTIPSSSSSSSSSSSNPLTPDEQSAPYRTLKGGYPVHIHPSSVLFSGPYSRKLPSHVIYSELLITSKRYMRGVTAIEGTWLTDLVPQIFAIKS